MSNFDPAIFLQATMTEPCTKRSPLPADDYVAVIKEITPKSGSKDGRDWYALEVQLALEIPPQTRDACGIDSSTITLRDSIFLDVTANGGLDQSRGKNGKLGLYRNALDMNKAGESFSPAQMAGRTLQVKIKHDENGREKVATVAKV